MIMSLGKENNDSDPWKVERLKSGEGTAHDISSNVNIAKNKSSEERKRYPHHYLQNEKDPHEIASSSTCSTGNLSIPPILNRRFASAEWDLTSTSRTFEISFSEPELPSGLSTSRDSTSSDTSKK